MKDINALKVPITLEDVCTPQRLALLVYDMQVGIKSQLTDGDAIAGKVRQVLMAARASGVRTFFTRHLSPRAMRN